MPIINAAIGSHSLGAFLPLFLERMYPDRCFGRKSRRRLYLPQRNERLETQAFSLVSTHLKQNTCTLSSTHPHITLSNLLTITSSKLAHHIINQIPSKRGPSPKNSRVPKLHCHVLGPFVMLRILGMRRITRVLSLLRYHTRVELVRWIRELGVDILGGSAVLARELSHNALELRG